MTFKNTRLKFLWKVIAFGIFLIAFLSIPLQTFGETIPKFSFNYQKEELKGINILNSGESIEGTLVLNIEYEGTAVFEINLSKYTGSLLAVKDKEETSPLNIYNWVEFEQDAIIEYDSKNSENENQILIPFKLTIPKNISPGDYQILFVTNLNEYLSSEDEEAEIEIEKTEENKGGAGVKFGIAVGLPFKFSIPGERFYKLNFKNIIFESINKNAEDSIKNDIIIVTELENIGNSMVSPELEVVLTDWKSDELYSNIFTLAKVNPGETKREKVVIPKIESFQGWLDLKSSVKFYPVDINGGIQKENMFDTGSRMLRIYAIPWFIISLILAIVILTILIFAFFRFRFLNLRKYSKLYTVKQSDTLQSVAQKFKIPAKDIIISNKLKSPYFLETGTQIYIPLSHLKK